MIHTDHGLFDPEKLLGSDGPPSVDLARLPMRRAPASSSALLRLWIIELAVTKGAPGGRTCGWRSQEEGRRRGGGRCCTLGGFDFWGVCCRGAASHVKYIDHMLRLDAPISI